MAAGSIARIRYPIGTPREWIASGHRTCSVQCMAPRCDHVVNVVLSRLPPDWPWPRVYGAIRCEACGRRGVVNITPNWHDAEPDSLRPR
ncbi:hypothetical protein BBta_4180 [Bradyrhizobium sp. BTAi1]|nr:hypothetical protein BBta_4180 [Bradyrhizobium sp. BTAi1]